jgi:hypothetical protein
MKNSVFATKKPIDAESQLRLNRWIEERPGWNMADIDERQALLAGYVPRIWARF